MLKSNPLEIIQSASLGAQKKVCNYILSIKYGMKTRN